MIAAPFRMLSIALLLVLGANAAAAKASLYERLGGQSGVAAIADTLIDRVAADPTLGRSFADTNLKHIKTLLAEQICDLSGGPVPLLGRHDEGNPCGSPHFGSRVLWDGGRLARDLEAAPCEHWRQERIAALAGADETRRG